MLQLLLVLAIVNGDPVVFAVKPESPAHCIVLETTAATWLPKLLGQKPEFYAAKCTELKPFLTAT